jgi:soluble lytic murein transglycosylase
MVLFVLTFILFSEITFPEEELFIKEEYKKIISRFPDSPLYEESFIRLLRKAETSREFYKILSSKNRKFLPFREAEITYLKIKWEKNEKKKKKLISFLFKKYPYSYFTKEIARQGYGSFEERFNILYKFRDFKGVMELIREKKEIKNPDILFKIAYAFFKIRKYDTSLIYIKKAEEKGYDNKIKTYFYRGLCHLLIGDTLKAIENFLKTDKGKLSELASKEIRLIFLKSKKFRKHILKNLSCIKNPKHQILLLVTAGEIEKAKDLLTKNITKDFSNDFLYIAYLLTNNKTFLKKYKKNSPLSYFSLREEGLCIENTGFTIEYKPLFDTLTLYIRLNLRRDFWNRVNKIKEYSKLINTALYLDSLGYYSFSIRIARKLYFLKRTENTVCFPEFLLKLLFPLCYKDVIFKNSVKYGVPPELVYAIIRRESLFDTLAVSPKGAKGIMQLMEQTAKRELDHKQPEFNLFNLKTNIEIGIKHLSSLRDSLGNWNWVIVAYNAGINKAKEWRRVIKDEEFSMILNIPYEESRKYLFYVLSDLYVYKLLYPDIW